ncbi:2,3-bisphosphoglycerate-independent phosphoglycerate mutase [Rhipicephalus microplus]|uniref:2,3-bisphosphoglycerate-independent phosphoglycerate mutase n=1 Tax=Rhipicephalus microplus TaxID=6941 RepID=UPI003F6D6E3C
MTNVCLIVIDGWGLSDEAHGNAILNGYTPVMDALSKNEGQFIPLEASGLAVGLPAGLMGNSEVGHLNIGAGRVILQEIVRIDQDMDSGAIQENKNFVEACDRAKSKNGRLHLLGLCSDGGVHAHIKHIFALLDGTKKHGVPHTFIQFFGDGRDTSPTSAIKYAQQVLDKCAQIKYGSLATVIGRYYAMDRDKREERVKIAYEGLVQGIGDKVESGELIKHIQGLYGAPGDKRQTDEFFKPIIVDPNGRIKDGDTLLFCNFRADRARQLTEALGIKPLFETSVIPKDLKVYTMTVYKKEFPFTALYPPVVPKNVLAEWLGTKGKTQFHCAETEKYAHVTFFFNGGQEKAFPGEDRCLVPSPKVATYDLKPEMSSEGVANKMVAVINEKKYPFVMCNFAPPDMVGHTGVYEAALKAVAATDVGIGRIMEACAMNNYVLLVTADHGNAEMMMTADNKPVTKHTTNKVPFCINGGGYKFCKPEHTPALCDVAPTVLDLLKIPQPPEMTGKSLLAH